MIEQERNKILVIGSSNTDMVIKSSRIPEKGETILGGEFIMNPGGKGANQAVAAVKLGGDVIFISKLGNDLLGESAIEGFKKVGIDTSKILIDKTVPSGVALIMVDDNGENSISVALGANAKLSADNIAQLTETFKSVEYVLVQLEIPIETVNKICEIASDFGKKVVLNPAPAQKLSDDILKHIYALTPNETEAKLITGVAVQDKISAQRAAEVLKDKGVPVIIITLGIKGAYVYSEDFIGLIPAPKVKAIDATAAGDTFNGALVVALAEGKTIEDAVLFANKAAALSVTKLGAQSSTPFRSQIT